MIHIIERPRVVLPRARYAARGHWRREPTERGRGYRKRGGGAGQPLPLARGYTHWYRPGHGVTLGLDVPLSDEELLNWTDTRATVSDPSINAPTGDAARRLAEDTSSNTHVLISPTDAAMETGLPTMMECTAKTEGTRNVSLLSGGGNGHWFDLATGAVGGSFGTVHAAGVEDLGSGWYRCWSLVPQHATETFLIAVVEGAGTLSYAGDGSSSILLARPVRQHARTSAFADQIGTEDLAQATGASQPAYLRGNLDVRSHHSESGSPYLQAQTASAWSALHSGTGCTIGVRFDMRALGQNRILWATGVYTDPQVGAWLNLNTLEQVTVRIGNGTTRETEATGAGAIGVGVHTLIYSLDGQDVGVWLDGVQVIDETLALALSGSDPHIPLRVLLSPQGDLPFRGGVQEIIAKLDGVDADPVGLHDYLIDTSRPELQAA